MKLKYYGHSCFSFESKGKQILIDPFITGNPLATNILIDDIQCDYILLSHGHGDHIADTEAIAKANDATIISSHEIATYYQNLGIKAHGMNHGGKFDFDFGRIKVVNAVHSSSFPDGSYAGNPMGFVIQGEEKNFYFAGDTALTYDMKLLPLTCPKLDFAILPIGDNYTMGYEDALIASDFIECDHIIGCHFDSFEVIKINSKEVETAFKKRFKEIILPSVGQEINVWEK